MWVWRHRQAHIAFLVANIRTATAQPEYACGFGNRAHYPCSVALDPSLRDTLVIVAFVLAAVATLLGALALTGQRKMKRDLVLLAADDDAPSFVEAVSRQAQQVNAMRDEVDDLSALLSRTRVELADAVRHVSVVRYDAFGDMGGRLSFSAALLDDGGDGLVLTSIHGRSETRSYMKGIKAGKSEAPLSPEEQQAVAYAVKGRPA